MNIVAIVNPAAAGGTAAERWPRLEETIDDVFGGHEVRFSTSLDNATQLAREVLKEGASLVFAVGGDGMCSAIANGFLENGSPISPDAALGLIPVGTGSDLSRTLGIPRKPEDAIVNLRDAHPVPADLIRCTYIDYDGEESTRYALNAAQIGLGAVVAGRVNRSSKRIGGFVPYLMTALAVLAKWKDIPVTVTLDETTDIKSHILEIAVSNGRYFGGGMHIAPRASMHDGRIDFVAIGETGLFRAVTLIPSLFRGTILGRRNVTWRQCTKISVATEHDEVPVEVDGEDVGYLPATFEVVPGALNLLVPK